MSTDQTPALARATEALVHEFGLLPEEAEGMHDDAARAAVSAALTNDADPDWLARVIYESTYPGVDGLPEWDEMDPAGATRLIHGIYADAVRTAILGEVA